MSVACANDVSFGWWAFLTAMASNLAFALRANYSKGAMAVFKKDGNASMTPANVYGVVTILAFALLAPVALLCEGVEGRSAVAAALAFIPTPPHPHPPQSSAMPQHDDDNENNTEDVPSSLPWLFDEASASSTSPQSPTHPNGLWTQPVTLSPSFTLHITLAEDSGSNGSLFAFSVWNGAVMLATHLLTTQVRPFLPTPPHPTHPPTHPPNHPPTRSSRLWSRASA